MATAKKISQLTAVVTPAGTDVLAAKQGSTTKKLTVAQLLTLQGSGQPFGIQFFIAAGEDATFILDQFASFAYTIVTAVAKTVSGTITMEVNIDDTEVTGIDAMAITSSESTDTASGQNSVAAGATVDLIFTANSDAVGLSVKLNCTRD